jgi:hydroxymethylpyrimidine/phosphomethylpyrimidine kinase
MNLHQGSRHEKPVAAVLVGGLDPGTGAGVARDLMVACALGARGFVIGTAWTMQGVRSSHAIDPRPSEDVAACLSASLAEAGPSAGVKIGMVANATTAQAIRRVLQNHPGPVVFDPVLRSSRGGELYQGDRASVLDLARRSTLLTPNLAEAGWLLGREIRNEGDARAAATDLRREGIPAVLVKGGHLDGEATDVLSWSERERLLTGRRVPGPSPRGTGCALATAITVALVRGETLDRAVAWAKAWLATRIAVARDVGGEWHL